MKVLFSYFFLTITVLLFSNSTEVKKTAAPDFTLKDINGKPVSLSSFKGKVVYLDIWASWCAPCIGEINKAKSVKEHFHGKDNVVFLYISIDKDEERWKQMVHKKDIKGVHLISKGGEEEGIVQKYQVPSIPRFILIDKNGNVANWEAKWPSDKEELIADIESLLAK